MYYEYHVITLDVPSTTPAPALSGIKGLRNQRENYSEDDDFPIPKELSEEEQLIWQTRHIAYGIIAPTLIAVGILGNLLTIFTLNHKRFQGMTYTFFRVLAVSDLIGLLFCISFVIHILEPLTPVYATAYWYAHFEVFASNVPFSTSVLTVTCITIDRFFSVCRPTQFKKIHTKKNAHIGMVVSILASVLIWLPVCFQKEVKEFSECESFEFERIPNDNQTYYVACMDIRIRKSPGYTLYSWTRQTIVSFIPIIVLLVLNTMIIRGYREVVRRRREMTTQSLPNSHNSFQESGQSKDNDDQNLIKMLYAIMITFFITMLPPGVGNALYTEFLSSDLQYEIFRAVANSLEILNHVMNFYLYMILSKPLRHAIKEFFQKKTENIDESITSTLQRIRKNLVNNGRVDPIVAHLPPKGSDSPGLESKRSKTIRHISNTSLISDSSELVRSPRVSSDVSVGLSSTNSECHLEDRRPNKQINYGTASVGPAPESRECNKGFTNIVVNNLK